MLETDMLYHLSPTLVRRKFVEPRFLAIQDTDTCGAIHLMTREGEEVAVDVLHIDLEMRGALRAIHQHGDAVLMGNGNHLLHGIDGAEHVAHVGQADKTRMLIEELAVGLLVERAVVVHGNHTELETVALGL